MVSVFVDMKAYLEPIILILAIIFGSLSGILYPLNSNLVDYSIILMLCCLFFNVSIGHLLQGVKNKKYLSIAWMMNFVLLPTIAFLISSIFVDTGSMLFVGLIFYLVAPCTDWFLGFTKLADGDVDINLALLPINLLSQILLLPFYLLLFTNSNASIDMGAFFDVLLSWLLYPFLIAQLLRSFFGKIGKVFLDKASIFLERGMVISLTILVFAIFNNNIQSLVSNLLILPVTLLVVACFFLIAYFLGLFISKKFGFTRAEKASLIITSSARNTPLMLAISVGLFPSETVIQLILILGMLIEFPHLILLSLLLRK
ncbi:hypothetical protein DID78_00050 [Candidatus Marinamargulisbacteria bacterium SCGC AG-343-D04]|nr:hypothetical protein DID78_00050 [Candidatus Marinamargulisbacteria bacterium SCGC AG-343-D04]